MSENEHVQAPTDPRSGDRFSCPRCGFAAEFVVLDDGLPGEWVSVPPPDVGPVECDHGVFRHCPACCVMEDS